MFHKLKVRVFLLPLLILGWSVLFFGQSRPNVRNIAWNTFRHHVELDRANPPNASDPSLNKDIAFIQKFVYEHRGEEYATRTENPFGVLKAIDSARAHLKDMDAQLQIIRTQLEHESDALQARK
jgi:hypothetical protein